MSAPAEKLEHMAVTAIPAEAVVAIWEKVAPILDCVVRPELGYSLDHVLTELQLRRWQLWVLGDFDGVVITTVIGRPLGRVLQILYTAGAGMFNCAEDWLAVEHEYAAHNNCTAVEFQSTRKGWEKICAKFPKYDNGHVIYHKELG
jgi:hypothetical protein